MEFGPYDNKHMVGMQAGKIAILMPPKPGQLLTQEEAIGLAAWLAVMAGDIDGEKVVKAIENNL